MSKHRIAPTVAYIRSLRVGGWASFKHKLHRVGVLPTPVPMFPLSGSKRSRNHSVDETNRKRKDLT
jgi:hypothetical protein